MTHFWSLGRIIASCVKLRLPRVASQQRPDLRVTRAADTAALLSLKPTTAQRVRDHSPAIELLRFDTQYGLEFRHVELRLRFLFDVEAAEVSFATAGEIEPQLLVSIIEGPVLGLMLRLSGQALLHASSVRWQGRGLAISADSGGGKSTLAALLCQQGATAWSDDVLAYQPESARAYGDGRPRRLSPEAQDLAGLQHHVGAPIYGGSSKQFATPIPALSDVLLREQSLDHIFVLGARIDSDQPLRRALTGTQASAAVFAGRFPSWLRETQLQRSAFESAELLVQRVPVTLVHLPSGLLRLQGAVETVMSWFDSAAGDPSPGSS